MASNTSEWYPLRAVKSHESLIESMEGRRIIHYSWSLGLATGSSRDPVILYRREREYIFTARKRLRRICFSAVSDFQVQKEAARFVISLLKEIGKYLARLRFNCGLYRCTPTLIQIYMLLNKCCDALEICKKPKYGNKVILDNPMVVCSLDLSLKQVLCDLDYWLARLNFRLRPNGHLKLRAYPLGLNDIIVKADPQANEMQQIIGGLKVTEKITFLSLEPIYKTVLPYLSRQDHDMMLQRSAKTTGSRISMKKDKLRQFQHHMLLSEQNRTLEPLSVDIEDIELGSGLGSGGFGEVFAATWLGRSCAVKRIRCNMEDLIDEASVQFRQRHPNIVQVFGVVRMGEYCGVVMERLHSNLKDFIFQRKFMSCGSQRAEEPPFTKLVAVDIMLQIARAMMYLHFHKIMHRDLKPQNILVSFNKRLPHTPRQLSHFVTVKLTDFGLATVKRRGSEAETLTSKAGTAYYRAPEVLSDNARYGLKADVYSFAVTSLEILTGKNLPEGPRFGPHNLTNINGNWTPQSISALQHDDFVRKIHVDILENCLDSDPSNRPSFRDICEMLQGIKRLLVEWEEGDQREPYCCCCPV